MHDNIIVVRRQVAVEKEMPNPVASATYAARQAGHLGIITRVAPERSHPVISPVRGSGGVRRRRTGSGVYAAKEGFS